MKKKKQECYGVVYQYTWTTNPDVSYIGAVKLLKHEKSARSAVHRRNWHHLKRNSSIMNAIEQFGGPKIEILGVYHSPNEYRAAELRFINALKPSLNKKIVAAHRTLSELNQLVGLVYGNYKIISVVDNKSKKAFQLECQSTGRIKYIPTHKIK